MNKKIVELVKDRIIEQMEKGIVPWKRPWGIGGGLAVSHTTGKAYSFLNQLLLEEPGEYITFKQAQAEGGCVRKGEHGKMVTFWTQMKYEEEDKNGELVEKMRPVLRYYTVFNVNQCDGIETKHYKEPEMVEHDTIAEAEAIVLNYQELNKELRIIRDKKSNSAYYSPVEDYINVPCIEQYEDGEEFYSTLFHEMAHSTGHPSRLGRFKEGQSDKFGSKGYGKEELVAEISSSALCSECGIETDKSFKNSVGYIQGWIKAIKEEPEIIVTAASKAEKAVEFILKKEVA